MYVLIDQLIIRKYPFILVD